MFSNQHYTDRLSKASGIYADTYFELSKCGALISLLNFLQSHRCHWASSKATPYARTQVGPSSHRQSKSYFRSSPTSSLLFTFRTTAILPADRFDLLFFGFSTWCAHAAAVLSTFLTTPNLESAIKPKAKPKPEAWARAHAYIKAQTTCLHHPSPNNV